MTNHPSAYPPSIHEPARDPWHDRRCSPVPIWFSLGLIAIAIGAWVL